LKELIIKARENESDMQKLVNDFESLIKKCIRIYVKNPNFYEDAMQHGRMAVIQCIRKFDIDSSFPFQAYVKQGALYSMRDFGSKLWNSDLSLDNELDEDGNTLSDFIDGGEKTEDTFLKNEDIKRLYAGINSLTENQRKIIIEVYFENRTMIEICKARRCHYMNVVAIKDRALKKLREYLDK
jgi:RNA polymerase sporulation-specific sigma factor